MLNVLEETEDDGFDRFAGLLKNIVQGRMR